MGKESKDAKHRVSTNVMPKKRSGEEIAKDLEDFALSVGLPKDRRAFLLGLVNELKG